LFIPDPDFLPIPDPGVKSHRIPDPATLLKPFLPEFVYLGEVSVSQKHLQSFLKTASLLRIRGLAEDAEQDSVGNKKNHPKKPKKPHKKPTKNVFFWLFKNFL
jgi:hypothetical protein